MSNYLSQITPNFNNLVGGYLSSPASQPQPYSNLILSPSSPSTLILSPSSPFISKPVSNLILSPIKPSTPVLVNSPFKSAVLFDNKLIPLNTITPNISPNIGTTYFEYQDIGSDSRLRDKMISYFYDNLDKWLNDDFKDLLKFFVVKNGKVSLINSISQYKQNDNKDSDKKIAYIINNYLSKSHIKRILAKYVDKKKSEWARLYNEKHLVKEFMYKLIKNTIKEDI